MTDQPAPQPLPEDAEPAPPPPEQPFPWDEEEPAAPDDPDAPRQRHDAFTEAKKSVYLKTLVKTGCIADACRLVGPSPRTVYRHQESDPRFLRHCQLALKMSGAPVELTVWERAVEGVEEEVAVGGRMVKRRRFDSHLLRLLLQGSNPKKYGPRPGFKRKRLLRHERKRMEREIRAEIEAETPECSFDEAIEQLDKALVAFGARRGVASNEERLAAGWTKSPEGDWVPPGYGPIPGWVRPDPPADAEDPPHDSM